MFTAANIFFVKLCTGPCSSMFLNLTVPVLHHTPTAVPDALLLWGPICVWFATLIMQLAARCCCHDSALLALALARPSRSTMESLRMARTGLATLTAFLTVHHTVLILRTAPVRSWACNLVPASPALAPLGDIMAIYLLSLVHDLLQTASGKPNTISSPTLWAFATLVQGHGRGDAPIVMALIGLRVATAELHVAQRSAVTSALHKAAFVLWSVHFYSLVWRQECAAAYPSGVFYLFLFINIHVSLPVFVLRFIFLFNWLTLLSLVSLCAFVFVQMLNCYTYSEPLSDSPGVALAAAIWHMLTSVPELPIRGLGDEPQRPRGSRSASGVERFARRFGSAFNSSPFAVVHDGGVSSEDERERQRERSADERDRHTEPHRPGRQRAGDGAGGSGGAVLTTAPSRATAAVGAPGVAGAVTLGQNQPPPQPPQQQQQQPQPQSLPPQQSAADGLPRAPRALVKPDKDSRGRGPLASATGTAGSDFELTCAQAALCVVCQSALRTVLLRPCRHVCVCEACTESMSRYNMQQCPVCRTPVQRAERVYL